MKDYRGKLTTTWPVITETCYMLDFSRETQLDFLDWIVAGGLEIYNIHQWQVGRVREWFATYSDLPADMADCTLMEVAETEKIHSIITLDRDFSIYKLGNGHYLENLLAG